MIKYLAKFLLSKYFQFRNRRYVIFLQGNSLDRLSEFEGKNRVGENNTLINTSLGLGTYISSGNYLVNVRFGRFCSIGSNIRNVRGIHPSSIFVSSHPSFFSTSKVAGFTFSKEQLFEEHKRTQSGHYVDIGHDVWIGDNVTIQEGITIGDGAIIGTNSLITKDIPPYSVNIGVPSRTIRYRFSPDEIAFLTEFKWWDKSFSWIQQNYLLFSDIKVFMASVREKMIV